MKNVNYADMANNLLGDALQKLQRKEREKI